MIGLGEVGGAVQRGVGEARPDANHMEPIYCGCGIPSRKFERMFRGSFLDAQGKARSGRTSSGARRVSGTPPRGVVASQGVSATGDPAPQRAPLKSLIIAIPAAHSIELDRITAQMPDDPNGAVEVIVACAGQPADLPAIHTHLTNAQFLLAPLGTSAEELRVLAISQAVGDIVTFVSGVPTGAPRSVDRGSIEARMGAEPDSPSLSIIVPVHNGGAHLGDTLAAIGASGIARDGYELIAVDDASTDGSVVVAARYADTLVRLKGHPRGAAYARNRGVDQACGDLIAFVDADVRVRRDTLSRMIAVLNADAGIAAVGASNDGTSADGGVATHYWNLLQEFGAQQHGGFGIQFSASCGVVRLSALLTVGMYNEWLFRGASLEDLELGQRLRNGGYRVLFCDDVPVSHLRRQSVRRVFATTWRRSSLLVRSLGYRRSREFAAGHVVHVLRSATGFAVAFATVMALASAFAFHTSWIVPVALASGAVLLTNYDLLRFFARRRGLVFTVAAIPLHMTTQVIGSAGLCAGWLLRHTIGDPAPNATMQAFAEMGVQMWPPVPRRP